MGEGPASAQTGIRPKRTLKFTRDRIVASVERDAVPAAGGVMPIGAKTNWNPSETHQCPSVTCFREA